MSRSSSNHMPQPPITGLMLNKPGRVRNVYWLMRLSGALVGWRLPAYRSGRTGWVAVHATTLPRFLGAVSIRGGRA